MQTIITLESVIKEGSWRNCIKKIKIFNSRKKNIDQSALN